MSGGWRHLTDAQIEALVIGALADAEAASLAEHLDDCPRCAGAVASADPLRPLLLADAPAPACPADLFAAILSEAQRAPEPNPAPSAPRIASPTLPSAMEPACPRWPAVLAASALIGAAALGLHATGELGPSLQWGLDGLRASAALSRSLGQALGAPLWLIALELPLLGAAAWWAYRRRALRPVI